MLQRIWTLFLMRNKEFYRDKGSLIWNMLFPFIIIVSFNVIFNDDKNLYKVGVVDTINDGTRTQDHKPVFFLETKFIDFVSFRSIEEGLDKLKHHRIDFLIRPASKQYWVNTPSPKGYIVEKLLAASFTNKQSCFEKQLITGEKVSYTEWLFPGILAMNTMFSALFGVGYVIVRYRKNGVLKRLSVAPTKTYEFLIAQILSRMFIILLTTIIVYFGCVMLYGFKCNGSLLNLLVVFSLGLFSLISLGLLISARSSSEEFAGGILNLISLPMMFLSEVWFSLEGANPWVIYFSKILPLAHLVDASRKIMNDGAGLSEIKYHITALVIMSLLFLTIGSFLFRWQKT